MTDQQPHTPYIEDGWLVEPCEPDYAPGISQPIPGSWSKPIVNLAELDGYDELIAAAERRGAEETLAYLIEDYPAYASHEEIRAWIQARLDHVRNADQIGGKICGLDGCESDEIAGHMQDGTLICYDCAREGEMEGGE